MSFFKRPSYMIFPHNENPPTIRLGLCCINSVLRKQNIFCSRTLIAKNYTKEKANDRVLKNLTDLLTLLEWNFEHGISHFRMSSDMFPRITDIKIPEKERVKVKDYKEILFDIGEYARKTKQRLTMHPAQFNQVGAKTVSVFESTLLDLSIHAEILDSMGMDDNGILTVHGGGVYGDKETTIRRWIEQFDDLPRSVKNRLAIENCERQYNISDVLYISEQCKIPVIFDSHHLNCYNQIHSTSHNGSEYVPYVLESWGTRRAVFHISDQKEGGRVGAHSDYIKFIPDYFLNIPEKFGVGVDIEVEAKAKEEAIFKLYEKYPSLKMF